MTEHVHQRLMLRDRGPVATTALEERHWPQVHEIYACGIATGQATFEPRPPSWERFDAMRPAGLRHVAVDVDGSVLGWVAATPVSPRLVYSGVIEESVYVHPDAAGRGIGRLLLRELIVSAEAAGIWTIEAKIFPENRTSLTLHRRTGFEAVGIRRRLALMTHGPFAGQWRDILLLERRSPAVGNDLCT